LYWPNINPTSRAPTPMSPAGTSVNWPVRTLSPSQSSAEPAPFLSTASVYFVGCDVLSVAPPAITTASRLFGCWCNRKSIEPETPWQLRTDVLAQLGHEGLAEAHDLVVGLALGVKVAAALAAAHGQGRQAVLQDLCAQRVCQRTNKRPRIVRMMPRSHRREVKGSRDTPPLITSIQHASRVQNLLPGTRHALQCKLYLGPQDRAVAHLQVALTR